MPAGLNTLSVRKALKRLKSMSTGIRLLIFYYNNKTGIHVRNRNALDIYACLFYAFYSIYFYPAGIYPAFYLRNPCNRQYAGFLRHVQSPLLSAALHRQVRMEFLSFPT